jgi:hypothetical protein
MLGESSVLCSVVGPAEVKIRDEKLDRATIDVVARPLVGVPGVKDKAIERNIREVLESLVLSGLHPRTGIQIVVQTMRDDGCVSPYPHKRLSIRDIRLSGHIISPLSLCPFRSCRLHSMLSS